LHFRTKDYSMKQTARRMADIQPFHVMEILKRAHELSAQGRDIIHLEVGEPDFPSPPPVVEAAQRFLSSGQVHYTPALGLPALREAISRFYLERFGARVAPERIVITPGASGALMLALAVLTNPGDEWLLPDPGYPSNRHLVRSFEGRPVALNVDASTRFQPTPVQVEAAWTPQTRGLMVATPANPTGTLLTQAEILALYQSVRQRGGVLLVDEIYQGLNYGLEASTALSQLGPQDDMFVVNSFSKYFGMTGWRLGWLVAPMCGISRSWPSISSSPPPPRPSMRRWPPLSRPPWRFWKNAATPLPGGATPCSRPCGTSALNLPPSPRGRFICTRTSAGLPAAARNWPVG
jgi:aspartate/methionine/tyrosine aminotransferase